MNYKSYVLDPFQIEAVKAIEEKNSVVVSAPTGSGKTVIADYIIEKHKNDPVRIIYTAPIKALSNQKYREFAQEYGEANVGLITGDLVINHTAKILVMTTEVYRNMAITGDADLENVAYVIFDEIHYINDPERGYVWEESVIYSSEKIRFLCLSATIPNSHEFANWIQAIKKHPVKTVVSTHRVVPLRHFFYDYELGITSLEKIKEAASIPYVRLKGKKFPEPNHLQLIKELGEGKLPCLFFHFSRGACQQKAQELARQNLFPKNAKLLEMFQHKLRDAPAEVNRLNSTRILKETLPQGIAFHHAGLLPLIKEALEDLFGQGLLRVLYVTETFAVGINMPAKTVCFDSLRKFDGHNFRNLNSKEYFQIAGRAGRRGIDTEGDVVTMIYRPTFHINEVKAITTRDVEPIQSQFKLGVNTVLNLINRHTPQQIEKILRQSFFSYQKFGQKYDKIPSQVLLATYNSILRRLRKLEYVEGNALTAKGKFAANIFADEMSFGEIFSTGFWEKLDEYQILLLFAALAYEHRENNEFHKTHNEEKLHHLLKLLKSNEWLSREKKFRSLLEMTALIHPIYHGKTFFDVLENTNFLEGDLIRIFSQILDRVNQVRKATLDYRLERMLENCRGIVEKSMAGIYLV
ncbi:DEAD/DEAH box helicase [Candidatus Woesearchaeota archaeon]|nr:DEAD/DEAH box helicase [Candidatus Woesearchaeota archaeon]